MSANNGNGHRAAQRLANENLLDERWALFRKELLNRIDRNPELYLDANIQFQIIRGRVMNANATVRHDDLEFTDRFRIKEHLPVG